MIEENAIIKGTLPTKAILNVRWLPFFDIIYNKPIKDSAKNR